MRSSRYRGDIDGLRAVAVLSVVFYHLELPGFSGGYTGVDVFFVISGFLITRLIRDEVRDGTFRFSAVYLRRARRLFPALFVTLAVVLLGSFLLFSPDHFAEASGSLVYAVVSLSNVFFWSRSGYFDAAADVKPLLHTWSLSVEEQFYLIFPPLLWLSLRFAPRWAPVPMLIVLGGASLLLADLQIQVAPEAAFYLTPFRMMEFTLGAVVVWLASERRRSVSREISTMLGLVLVGYPVVAFTEATSFPGSAALVPCAGAALLIYAGNAPFLGKLLDNPVMTAIGKISYSFYLIHWPIIVFYKYFVYETLGMAERLGLLSCSLLAATAMYHFVERPFRYGHLRAGSLTAPAFGLACAMLALLATLPAATAWAQAGWPWRVPQTFVEPPHELQHIYSEHQTDGLADLIMPSRPDIIPAVMGADNRRTKRALIIGDSHAGHLANLADYLGKKYRIEFVISAYLGCPPIFGTHKIYGPDGVTKPKPRQTECKEFIAHWEKIVATKKFDYVILASRWDWLFEPTEFGDFKIRRDLLVADANPVYTVDASRETFKTYLPRTVQAILRSGAMPIVFSQVPPTGKDIGECDKFPTYLLSAARQAKRCSAIDQRAVQERLSFMDHVIADLAVPGRVATVIPSRYFCREGESACKTFEGGANLYSGDNHLSAYGSIFLAKQWEKSADFPFSSAQTGQ